MRKFFWPGRILGVYGGTMAELFRHRDVGDPSDELYVHDVDERFPDLGLHFGCHNPDQHCVVQLRPEAIGKLLDALIEWKAREDRSDG